MNLSSDGNAATEPAAGPRILIVDDNDGTARSLAKILTSASYRPSIALSGSEAIEHARAGAFEAALVDVHLQDVNGLIVSQQLREMLGPRSPIVIMSGDTSMEVINALRHIGATYFFSKPLNVPALLDQLKGWLSETQPAGN